MEGRAVYGRPLMRSAPTPPAQLSAPPCVHGLHVRLRDIGYGRRHFENLDEAVVTLTRVQGQSRRQYVANMKRVRRLDAKLMKNAIGVIKGLPC
jgi:hypothetical protein